MSFEVEYDNAGNAVRAKSSSSGYDIKFEADGAGKVINEYQSQISPVETPADQQPENTPDLSSQTPENTPDINTYEPSEQPEEVEITPEEQPRMVKETKDSWGELREKAWQAERRAKDSEYKLEQALLKHEYSERKSEVTWNEDELIEGKHLSAVEQKLQAMEARLAKYESKTAEQYVESKLKSEHPDFNSVVSSENLKKLQEQYPELAQALFAGEDLFAKGKSAYIMLKKLGIAQDKLEPRIAFDKAQALRNSAKPKPLSSLAPTKTSSPLSNVNAFSQGVTVDGELQAELVKQMNDAIRGF